MKSNEDIVDRFKRSVCDGLRLIRRGADQFLVSTPLTYDDGDQLPIVLKRESGGWVLSDEGQGLMHLGYDLNFREIETGPRKEIFERTVKAFALENRQGELVLPLNGQGYDVALYSFIHALMRIDDIRLLSHDQVKSNFYSDFQGMIESRVPEERRYRAWHDERYDPAGIYPVDYLVEGKRPVYVFGLPTTGKVQVSTITLLQFEHWGIDSASIGIFEDIERVPRKAVARFQNVCTRTFTHLQEAAERFEDAIAHLAVA